MTQRRSLASLAPKKANAAPEPSAVAPATPPAAASPPAARKDEAPYKSILSKVDADTHRQMKILSVNEGVPIGDLQIEAINLLFRARGLPEIATRVTPDERVKR